MFSLICRILDSLAGEIDAAPVRRISDAFPDIPVTNQFGQRLQFRKDLMRGQGALIINTMFTTCRGSCPGTSATIASLRESLFPSFGKRLTFLSLTLEPLVDTPQKLLSYSRMYGAAKPDSELADWHFLTMSSAHLDELRRSMGFLNSTHKLIRTSTSMPPRCSSEI